MNPTPLQTNSTVPRSIKQAILKNVSQIRQNLRLAGRMQTVAAIVDKHAIDLETPGISSDILALFKNNRLLLTGAGQLPRGAEAGGPDSQDRYARTRHLRGVFHHHESDYERYEPLCLRTIDSVTRQSINEHLLFTYGHPQH